MWIYTLFTLAAELRGSDRLQPTLDWRGKDLGKLKAVQIEAGTSSIQYQNFIIFVYFHVLLTDNVLLQDQSTFYLLQTRSQWRIDHEWRSQQTSVAIWTTSTRSVCQTFFSCSTAKLTCLLSITNPVNKPTTQSLFSVSIILFRHNSVLQ